MYFGIYNDRGFYFRRQQRNRKLVGFFLILLVFSLYFIPHVLSKDNNKHVYDYELNILKPVKPVIIKSYIPVFKNVAYLHRVTAYNAVPWQTKADPYIASCGPNLPKYQVALSQNLFFKPNGQKRCGQKVLIELNDGRTIQGIVWDTMNPRYYNAADILMPHISQAVQFGIHQGKIIFVNYIKKYQEISF